MKDKIHIVSKIKENFSFSNGFTMKREKDTLTPNGIKMNLRWVLRNAQGEMVDFGQYRYDIAERNNIDLYTQKRD